MRWCTPRSDLALMARRAQKSLRARLFFANLAGATAVLVFLHLASGRELAPDVPFWLTFLVGSTTFVVLGVSAYVAGHISYGRAIRWALEGRAPTAREKREVLRQPWLQASRPVLIWAAAAVIYGGFAAMAGADAMNLSRLVWSIVLGGLTSCALAFLLVERSFRPLFAQVFAGEPPPRPRTLGVRMRVLLTWVVGGGVPLAGFALDAVIGDQATPPAAVTALAILCLGGGFIAAMATARSLAEPLDGVRDALGRVRDGDLGAGLVVDDGGEVGEVQAGFNQMVEGLRERRRLRDLFGRHVGQEVATNALERGTGLGGQQADASVIFVDLIGSTAMAEVLPPDDVVETLNDFFGVVVHSVDSEGGWVNKFEGDGALCIFGVPSAQPDHPARALRAARLLYRALGELCEAHPGLEAGIGVSAGQVVAGNVGTEARYEYTVIGPAVNEAARLTDVAKGRAVKVLASGDIVRRSSDEARRWRDVGTVALRGRRAPTAIYEPMVSERVAPV